MSGIEILLNDGHGIYIPQIFCKDFLDADGWSGVIQEDRETCSLGPDEDWYWDAWTSITDNAKFTDKNGNVWRLSQDGDLFAYCEQLMTDQEYEGFYGEPREKEEEDEAAETTAAE